MNTVSMIDCTPTWSAILPALLSAYTQGTSEGRKTAEEELYRLARIADDYVALNKKENHND